MEKKLKINLNLSITVLIILGILILTVILINNKKAETPNEIAQCIGEKSLLYTQLGCHACKTQENLFGESYQYLNKIDCYYNTNECITANITATPTWVINGEKYVGVQSVTELKELTNC